MAEVIGTRDLETTTWALFFPFRPLFLLLDFSAWLRKACLSFFPEGPAVRRPTNAPLDLAVLLVFALQCSGGGALPPNIRQGII